MRTYRIGQCSVLSGESAILSPNHVISMWSCLVRHVCLQYTTRHANHMQRRTAGKCVQSWVPLCSYIYLGTSMYIGWLTLAPCWISFLRHPRLDLRAATCRATCSLPLNAAHVCTPLCKTIPGWSVKKLIPVKRLLFSVINMYFGRSVYEYSLTCT